MSAALKEASRSARDRVALDNALALGNQTAARVDALEARVKAIEGQLAAALRAGLRRGR